jgi:hypothetical protein
MSEGTTAKRCYCRGEDGRQLGQKCPRLRRAGGGWSRHHGTWWPCPRSRGRRNVADVASSFPATLGPPSNALGNPNL